MITEAIDSVSINAILNASLIDSHRQDVTRLVWIFDKNEKFTVRFAYRSLIEHENLPNTCTFRKLWVGQEIQPHILYFIWRSRNDTLMTNAVKLELSQEKIAHFYSVTMELNLCHTYSSTACQLQVFGIMIILIFISR